MISAQQVKQILEIITSNSDNQDGTVPSISLSVTPNSYSVSDVPANIVFAGTIIPAANTFEVVGWTLKQGGTTLATGSGTTVSYIISGGSVPDEVGVVTYTLEVQYKAVEGGANLTTSITATVSVLEVGSIGFTTAPLLVAADLANATLEDATKQDMINPFEITSNATARMVIVIPNAFGTVNRISDNTDLVVTNEFSVINDGANNRKIYVGITPIGANTYIYKVTFN